MMERRQAKRGFLGASLQNWLRAVATRHRVASLAVADRQGLLIAGLGADAEEVAALAPLDRRRRGPIEVCDTSGTSPVLVCSRAHPHAASALREAVPGVRRILER
jgi:hypothetical protein